MSQGPARCSNVEARLRNDPWYLEHKEEFHTGRASPTGRFGRREHCACARRFSEPRSDETNHGIGY